MAFVYRYVDLSKPATVYVGKVTGDEFDALMRRHEQHKREEWYKASAKDIVFQYIDGLTPADADMLETYHIATYSETGQLVNKAKTTWGKSFVIAVSAIATGWHTYEAGKANTLDALYSLVRTLDRTTEGLAYHDIRAALMAFCQGVKELQLEMLKGEMLTRYDMQDDFVYCGDPPEGYGYHHDKVAKLHREGKCGIGDPETRLQLTDEAIKEIVDT